jgi:predicted ester cyclase/limonene-1,2-epoxide hydrolase
LSVGGALVDWRKFAQTFEEATDARRGDTLERWTAMFAPGGTFQDPVNAETTDYASIARQTQQSTPDWHAKVRHIVEGGDHSGVLEWIGRATLLGRAPIELEGCTLFEVDGEGRVTKWRDYFDVKAIENQARDVFAAAASPSTAAGPGALLRRIATEIWDEGKIDLIDELIDEDLIDHVEVPGLEGSGRERYRASLLMTRSAFPDFRHRLDIVMADGDLAMFYGRISGTNSGELGGMSPTGRTVDYPTVGVLRFRNGRAVERWGFGDTGVMLKQMGLLS